MTSNDKQAVRAYVLGRNGAEKVRVMTDESVQAYGVMPNSNEPGWYFAGWAKELLAMAEAERAV